MLAWIFGAFFLYVAGEGKLQKYIDLLTGKSSTGTSTSTGGSSVNTTPSTMLTNDTNGNGLFGSSNTPIPQITITKEIPAKDATLGYGTDGNYGLQSNAQ